MLLFVVVVFVVICLFCLSLSLSHELLTFVNNFVWTKISNYYQSFNTSQNFKDENFENRRVFVAKILGKEFKKIIKA